MEKETQRMRAKRVWTARGKGELVDMEKKRRKMMMMMRRRRRKRRSRLKMGLSRWQFDSTNAAVARTLHLKKNIQMAKEKIFKSYSLM